MNYYFYAIIEQMKTTEPRIFETINAKYIFRERNLIEVVHSGNENNYENAEQNLRRLKSDDARRQIPHIN